MKDSVGGGDCFSLEGGSCCPRTGTLCLRWLLYHWSLAHRFTEPASEQKPWPGTCPVALKQAAAPAGLEEALRVGQTLWPPNAALPPNRGCREAPLPEGWTLRQKCSGGADRPSPL